MICERRESLVVVGNGMAGARLVADILTRAPTRFTITVFGAEPGGSYDRVQLSAVLGGFKPRGDIVLHPVEWYEKHGVRLHARVRVERIDRRRGVVVGRPPGRSFDLTEPYDRLVLATGSRPFVPPLEGKEKKGVFVFRTLEDCDAIAEHARGCRRAVVLGGGLLGLEAARGLVQYGLETTVVELAPHLMTQQLDPIAGAILKAKMEAMGVRVLVSAQVRRVLGEQAVTGVELCEGTVLDTDMVVVSCGIRANSDLAQDAGLAVNRGVVVDDQMHTADPAIAAVGECAEHRGTVYGLVEPVYEQARVLADVLTGANAEAKYGGSRLATTLKVMGVDLTSMGDVHASAANANVVVHSEPERGVYRKLVVRDGRLAGAVVLGDTTPVAALGRMFRRDEPISGEPLELLLGRCSAGGDAPEDWPDDTRVCNCNSVSKGAIVAAIQNGCGSVEAVGTTCRAGTGCGSCQGVVSQLLAAYTANGARPGKLSKVELLKQQRDGLDVLADIHAAAERGAEPTADEKQLYKWHGLFWRQQTPGQYMLRVRMTGGATNSRQLRVLAELSDEYGKGFADLTTRQQVQLRWFTIANVPDIFRRLEAVGLTGKQTGMDNVRGVCGCPMAGLSAIEALDASDVAKEFTDLILDNREFTNLPRKFNVTITGCTENCCHTETQDLALVPARRLSEVAGLPFAVVGFNLLVGGKQGSGGYDPAVPLDVFVTREEAAAVCGHVVRIFRDHGAREQRTRARLHFLVADRGATWFRAELEKRVGRKLDRAGADLRGKQHTDHLGIHPQRPAADGSPLCSCGLLVPVGRITTAQMRGIADLAERYGNGDVRLTVQQNLVIPNVPEAKLPALKEEPLLRELEYDPSPVLRGLVSCVGSDYCHFALIETKGWAIDVARELDRRTKGKKVAPLSIHWSGCPAGCGLHQVGTIGLQGCRSRVNGQVVDAAHVCVNGKSGPKAQTATDLMYDVPCDQLADALELLVTYLPR